LHANMVLDIGDAMARHEVPILPAILTGGAIRWVWQMCGGGV
jgi:hypothetical protein